MRRIITIMLAAVMALSALQVSASAEAPAGHAIEKKTFPHLYCLISSSSFSCGNLVPAIFDQAGGITLIGQRSGGGSNVVLPGTTASGMIFQMSGPLQITTCNNGSLYGVDTGVEPHVRLNKTESFYDREALVEMIHGLK